MRAYIALACIFLTSYVKSDETLAESKRNGKLFSLFSVVTFPNSQCTASSDNTMYGVCYTSSECATRGGSTDGNCAAGFGVCCTFTISTCGNGVSQNCTYITNPSYPSTYTTTGTCTHSVTPLNDDICQLRLDFDNFDITEATTGLCTDTFAITGQSGQNPHDLCGTLTGQHIYVENARSTSATTLTFTIATGGTWKIKVSQIECYSTSRAYPDCDQFMTGISGTVASYNWPNVQLRNTDWNICIRREEGYCGLQLSQAVPYTSPDSFEVNDLATAVTGAANGDDLGHTAAAEGIVTIAGVVGAKAIQSFGGQVFANDYEALASQQTVPGAAFISGNQQWIIRHTVNNVAQTDMYGFKLQWNQLSCSAADLSYRSDGEAD